VPGSQCAAAGFWLGNRGNTGLSRRSRGCKMKRELALSGALGGARSGWRSFCGCGDGRRYQGRRCRNWLRASLPLRSRQRRPQRAFACSTLMGLVRTRLAPIRNAFATPTCPSTTATAERRLVRVPAPSALVSRPSPQPQKDRQPLPRPAQRSESAVHARLRRERPSVPAIPSQKPAAAHASPHLWPPRTFWTWTNQDSDAILERMSRAADSANERTKHTPPATSRSGAPKFPWQPSPKMAEPMASALRRAAEAGGSSRTGERSCVKAPVAPPALKSGSMTGAMFQARDTPPRTARAFRRLCSVAAARAHGRRGAGRSQPAVREVSEPKTERPFSWELQPDATCRRRLSSRAIRARRRRERHIKDRDVEGVVLLASSAGYLSWKDTSKKSAPAPKRRRERRRRQLLAPSPQIQLVCRIRLRLLNR